MLRTICRRPALRPVVCNGQTHCQACYCARILHSVIEPMPDTHHLWFAIRPMLAEGSAQILEALRFSPLAPEPTQVPYPTFALQLDDVFLRDVDLARPCTSEQRVHLKEGQHPIKKRRQ